TLFDLETIRTKTGGVYGVYTPFARTLRSRGDPAPPMDAPGHIPAGPNVASDRLDDWALLPRQPDWSAGFDALWQPGETAAQDRLEQFAGAAVHGYDRGRNLPGEDGTSMLSPHLHWGELSPNQVWHAARQDRGGDAGPGLPIYLGEILWREFAAYLLWHHPHLPEQPLRPRFAALPVRTARPEFAAWRQGRTGVPIVDAGMRQLWQTGWMHNRVRMIASSFLVKHLLMSWQAGEDHFWDTLVDADLASNAAGWQWITGCGIDSQPWFRVFNPVSQSEKFDPAGRYIRQWVPELARVPDRYVHAPWTAPAAALGGLKLGRDYPHPLVDLAAARTRALDAYRTTVRGAPPDSLADDDFCEVAA
ncbi:MAG: cryptochrome/photolyase family protein, partial [Janthinobacterium lividum]